MAVLLTISETPAGPEVSDTLAGGDAGLDLGQVVNGQYAPLTNQGLNQGWQNLYFSHDATVDPITDVKTYLAQYSGTYGGPANAAADLTTMLTYGADDTGATKNNQDGLSRGLHIDMSWNVSDVNAFDYSRELTGQKRIYGKDYAGVDGSSLADAFLMHVDAMSYWNGTTEVDATTPVAGQIGKSDDTILGNRAHILMRMYLHSAALDGGIIQWDYVTSYSYTA